MSTNGVQAVTVADGVPTEVDAVLEPFFILPLIVGAVGRDDDVEYIVVRINALRPYAQWGLEVDVPALKLPVGAPNQPDGIFGVRFIEAEHVRAVPDPVFERGNSKCGSRVLICRNGMSPAGGHVLPQRAGAPVCCEELRRVAHDDHRAYPIDVTAPDVSKNLDVTWCPAVVHTR